MAGPGESTYTVYDRDIAARAQIWLHEEAGKWTDRPWVLFVSFVAPHFPLTAPPHWFYRYWQQDLPMPKLYAKDARPHHPAIDEYAYTVDYDTHFRSPADVKRALAGYAGLVSSLDENIGHVLQALQATGLADSTRVIYTSDHGDNLGARGLWGKSTLYEESAGVPLLMAGPDIPAGRVVETPVTHIDFAPTIVDAVGASALRLPTWQGASLFEVADGAQPERPVISEYHAIGASTGAFMIRFDRWKYCHYVARPPSSSISSRIRRNCMTSRPTRSIVRFWRMASGGCGRRSIRTRSTRGRSGGRRSCWRALAAVRRRSRAVILASRPAPGTAPMMN